MTRKLFFPFIASLALGSAYAAPESGSLTFERPGDAGIVNLAIATIHITGHSDLKLRGEESISVRLAPGSYACSIASPNPYPTGGPAWRSEPLAVSVVAGSDQRFLIESAGTSFLDHWEVQPIPNNSPEPTAKAAAH